MMFVLTVAVSRAVPVLFLVSALLVLARFLYDRYRPSNPRLAAVVFAAVPLLGEGLTLLAICGVTLVTFGAVLGATQKTH